MGKGSYRFRTFRLSELMPNSWFYKLRELGSRGSGGSKKVQNSMEKGQVPIKETGTSLENQNPITEPSQKLDRISNRRSYYIPSRNRVEKLPYFPSNPKVTHTHIPLARPRKNKTKLRNNSLSTHNKLFSSSVSSVNTCQEQSSSVLCSEPAHETPMHHFNGVFTDELNTTDYNISIPLSPIVTKPIKKETNKPNLAVVSTEPAHETPLHHLNGVFTDELNTTDYNLSIPLPPIVTKPIRKETIKPNLAVGNQRSKQGRLSSPGNIRRPSTPQTPRIKMRLHSSKPAEKRLQEKEGLADSYAVVKLSSDPQSDFKESMLDMILQNNLRASKDLEELLACYLYLNSDEYHDLIVKAFKQILLDLSVMNLHFK